jgi:hypothetical protein
MMFKSVIARIVVYVGSNNWENNYVIYKTFLTLLYKVSTVFNKLYSMVVR